MTWIWSIAMAAPLSLADLPAAVASADSWAARQRMVDAGWDRAEEDRPRWASCREVFALLAAAHADTRGARLRRLTEACSSEDERARRQALLAATLVVDVPELRSPELWYPMLPVPVARAPLALRFEGPDELVPPLTTAMTDWATHAGWTLDASVAPLTVTVSDPWGAAWGDDRGFAVTLTAEPSGATAQGFSDGPWTEEGRDHAVEQAARALLGHPAVLDALEASVAVPSIATPPPPLLPLPTGEVCLVRRPDSADLPLDVRVGPRHVVTMRAATHGCLSLPEGLVVSAPVGHATAETEPLLLEVSDRGTTPAAFTMEPADAERTQRLLDKDKIAHVPLVPTVDEP